MVRSFRRFISSLGLCMVVGAMLMGVAFADGANLPSVVQQRVQGFLPQAADVTPPTIDLTSLSVEVTDSQGNPKQGTTATAGDTVTVSVEASDGEGGSGVERVELYFDRPQTHGTTVYNAYADEGRPGTFSRSIAVTDLTEAGAWRLEYVQAHDYSGNSTGSIADSAMHPDESVTADLSGGNFSVAAPPELPADLSTAGYTLEFLGSDNNWRYYVDEGDSISPTVKVYYQDEQGARELLPEDKYMLRIQREITPDDGGVFEDASFPLTHEEDGTATYLITAVAKDGSGYRGETQGFYLDVFSRMTLTPFASDVFLPDNYKKPLDHFPFEYYEVPVGTELTPRVTVDNLLLDVSHYTVRYINMDTNEVLDSFPTTCGSYRCEVTGAAPFYGTNDMLEIQVVAVSISRTDGGEDLFSDSDATYKITVGNIEGTEGTDWELQVRAGMFGTFDDEAREFNDPLISGTEYAYDAATKTLTLYGDEICEHHGDQATVIRVFVVDTANNNIIAEAYEWVMVREARVDYDFEQSREMLPNSDEWISRFNHVFVQNSAIPNGFDGSYEVTNVEVIASDPAVEDEEVVRVERVADESDPENVSWRYESLNYGTATIKVTYKNPPELGDGVDSYTFEVHVVSDVYRVDIQSVNGSWIALPGGSIELTANARHDADHEIADNETFDYSWAMVDGAQFGTIAVNPSDHSKATMTFNDMPEGQENMWERAHVVVMLLGENEGTPIELAQDERWLTVQSDYLEIWPTEIDRSLEVGESVSVAAELRHYSLGSASANGYEVVNGVSFYWDYESESAEVRDANNYVVRNGDCGEANVGGTVPFTIVRKGSGNSRLELRAEWLDDENNSQSMWTEYNLDHRNYGIWMNSQGGRLYSDGTLDVTLEYDDSINTSVIVPTVTLRTWSDEGEGGWVAVENDGCFTIEGKVVTLDGAKLYERFGTTADLCITANFMAGDEPVNEYDNYFWFELREASVDYEKQWDRDMLPGWEEQVNRWYRVRVDTAARPDWETNYEVTDVAVVEGQDVVSVEKMYADDNPASGDFWWRYRALDYGTATIKVSYADIEGAAQSYTFEVHVTHDVYNVEIHTLSGSDMVLPGKSVELYAVGRHDIDYPTPVDPEPLSYQWTLDASNFPEGFVTLTVDPNDETKATLSVQGFDEGEGVGIWEDVNVSVILTGQDGQGSPVERARNDTRIHVASYYDELHPLSIENDLAVGSTIGFSAEVRTFSIADIDSYGLTDNVTFSWSYDDEVVEIQDVNHVIVGNGVVTDASTGSSVSFSIHRRDSRDSEIMLRAEWTTEQGENRTHERRYHLDQLMSTDLNDPDYLLEFVGTEGATLHDEYYVVNDGVTSITPRVELRMNGDPNRVVPADAYTVSFEKMGEVTEPGHPNWVPATAPLAVDNIYRVTLTAVAGSGYTGTWNPDDHEMRCRTTAWIVDKYRLWPYEASLGDDYAVELPDWPWVRFDIPEGAEYDLVMSLGNEVLDPQNYTVQWCDLTKSPDTIYNPDTHAQAILPAKPTTPGQYYAFYQGVDPYNEGGTVLFNIIAAPASYDVWVGGVRVTEANADDVFGDGTVSFDPERNVLTLDGANVTGSYEYKTWYEGAIYSALDHLTINVASDSVVQPTSRYADGFDCAGGCDITVVGDGTLTLRNVYYGAYVGGWPDEGGDLVIDGTTVVVENPSAAGLWANNSITINDSTVTVTTSSNYSGMVCNEGDITLTDSTISITSPMQCIHFGNGDEANHTLTIEGSTVTLESAGAAGVFVQPVAEGEHADEVYGAINFKGEKLDVASSTEFFGTNIAASDITIAEGYGYTTGESLSQGGHVVIEAVAPLQPVSIIGAQVTLSFTSVEYNGTAQEPDVTVKLDGTTLTPGTDYTVSYSNNTEAGTATVTVTGRGAFTDTAMATFTITRDKQVIRIWGDYANETSAAISKEAFPQGSEWVVIARDDDFADALGATGLAGALDAPIILTDRFELSPAAAAECQRLGAKHAYIIGGTGAIKTDVDAGLEAIGVAVEPRIWGDNSYDTSLACAKKIVRLGGDSQRAIIAMSTNFQDALSMSTFAYKYKVPVVLQTWGATSADRGFTSEAAAWLNGKGVIVAGGAGAISDASVAPYTLIERLWGDSGYDTSQAIAEWMVGRGYLEPDTVVFACGAQAPKGTDALAGAALGGKLGAPMLLVNTNTAMEEANTTTVDGFFTANRSAAYTAYVLGGAYVMPEALYNRIESLIGA